MGNTCGLTSALTSGSKPSKERKVTFSPSTGEKISFSFSEDEDEEAKNDSCIDQTLPNEDVLTEAATSHQMPPPTSPEEAIDELLDELYTDDDHENYINARMLLLEKFFSAEAVIEFESPSKSPSSSLSQSLSLLQASSSNTDDEKKEEETFTQQNTNVTDDNSTQNAFKIILQKLGKTRKLNYNKFSQVLLERKLSLPRSFSLEGQKDEKTATKEEDQLAHHSMATPTYRALLYSLNFDIYIPASFYAYNNKVNGKKKIRKAVTIRYLNASPTLGSILFSGPLTSNSYYLYTCLLYYRLAAKVMEFTVREVSTFRLLLDPPIVVCRRFWFELLNLLYSRADQLDAYWNRLFQTPPNSAPNSACLGEKSRLAMEKLQANLGLAIRRLFESLSSASEPVAERFAREVVTFATVVLSLPPKNLDNGIPGGSGSRNLCWDDLVDEYYKACKGRRRRRRRY